MTVARSGPAAGPPHGLRGVEWPRAQSVAVIDGAFSAPVRYSCHLRGGSATAAVPRRASYTKLCVGNVLAPQIGGSYSCGRRRGRVPPARDTGCRSSEWTGFNICDEMLSFVVRVKLCARLLASPLGGLRSPPHEVKVASDQVLLRGFPRCPFGLGPYGRIRYTSSRPQARPRIMFSGSAPAARDITQRGIRKFRPDIRLWARALASWGLTGGGDAAASGTVVQQTPLTPKSIAAGSVFLVG